MSTPAGGTRRSQRAEPVQQRSPSDCGDPYDLDGHRLLAQVQADPTDGVAAYTQDLGPGDYYVAVSGAGNTAFSPVIAGSGFDGRDGQYELTIGATDLGLAGDGPTVLSSDPAAGAVLDSSPLAIRVEMSGPIDPSTIWPGQTVQLSRGLRGGAGTPVALASVNFSTTADELQLFPLAPLAPGNYVVQLAGDASQGQPVLAEPERRSPSARTRSTPTGPMNPSRSRSTASTASRARPRSDDTAATARNWAT